VSYHRIPRDDTLDRVHVARTNQVREKCPGDPKYQIFVVSLTTFSTKRASQCSSNQFHRMGTGRFTNVSALKPVTATASNTHGSVGQRTRVKIQQSLWKQKFSPLAVGLLGLVIAVALWGFGYKLSLYHHDQAPSSRVSVAKLWIESRNASVLRASRLEAKSHLHTVSQAFPAPVRQFPRLGPAVVCTLPGCSHGVVYFNSLIPSRSPPPYRFRLA
jgi:hypothetical protein